MLNKRNNLYLKWLYVLFASASILGLLLISGCMVNEVSISRRALSNGNENSATAKVKLAWDEVLNATSYNLYYSEFPGVSKDSGNQIRNVRNPTTVTDLNQNTTYYFVVTAVNSHGESDESNEVFYHAE